MTPDLVIPGGWYADSRPDRTYAATVWHGKETWTHWGRLPNPSGDEPLWLAISPQGNKIAAQGWAFPVGYEFDGTQWNQIAAPCGVWCVIYRDDNTLFASRCEPPYGSQGVRYVAPSGRLVPGDETISVRHGLNERTDLSLAQDGSFEVGQCNSGAGVGVWIGGKLRVLSPGSCFVVRAKWDRPTNVVAICCYNVAPDGVESRFFWTSPEELLALPPVEEPTQPIGPLVPSRVDDGRSYDLLPFFIGDASTWPRVGPTHTYGQIVRGEMFYYVKFAGNEPGAAHGECHEAWSRNEEGFYQNYDRSNGPAIVMSDPRMYPRKMRIGEAHAFTTSHELIRLGNQCEEVVPREPIGRKMWLYALWDRYWCGPDLGERPVMALVYDNTAGIHGPGRNIELGFYALGAGSFRWESHASERVYG